ncbi:MAG: serine protease [Alphaproteobacteria bacterium]|nr:serine protease [Alphaproteobacteria bacterium]
MKQSFAYSLFGFGFAVSMAMADTTAKSVTADTDMIVNGKSAPANKWPWQVRLFEDSMDGRGICGGTLIASQWVLTAAHCTEGRNSFVIGYGSNSIKGLKRVNSAKVITHPGFKRDTMENDIALIKLVQPVKMTKGVATASLPPNGYYNSLEGKTTTVTGWGYLYDLESFQKKFPNAQIDWNTLTPDALQEVDVPVQNFDKCRQSYIKKGAGDVPMGQMCAGLDRGGKDSCQGDSGGPLVVADAKDPKGYVQVGIVSWGRGCALPKLFGIYTRTDFYQDWIAQNLSAKN